MMSLLPRALLRQRSIVSIGVSSFRSNIASLHTSLEQSTELLLRNRPNDVILRFKQRADKDIDELHPLEKNLYALGLLFNGDVRNALEVQTQTVMYFTQSLGSTSDSFLDIAGSLNDLAVIHIANKDYSNAEKQLKRALLMVERSYRVDTHLRSSLLANLSNVHRLTGNKELCLQYTDILIPLLSSNYHVAKQKSVDISNLNPAESQEALDLFWKNLTQPDSAVERDVAQALKSDYKGGSTSEKGSSGETNNGIIRDRFYYSKGVFPSIRKIQFTMSVAHCIGTARLHEEGLIYMNKVFEMILLNVSLLVDKSGAVIDVNAGIGNELLMRDTLLLPIAIARLADLTEDSKKHRGKGISAKHIQYDNLSNLFKLPYFQNKFPSVAQLELSLTSNVRDLKNAAVQIHKSQASLQMRAEQASLLSEYDRVLLSGVGIVGVALMDIEHHCLPTIPV